MSRRLRLIGLAVLSLAVAAPAAAQDSAPVHVTASSAADGMRVRYRLPRPVERFVFDDQDTVRERWSVATPGLTLADGAVTGETPFDAFEIRIAPDAAEVDRVYIGLSRVGAGQVLYGPGLKAADQPTVLAFDAGPGEAALPVENPVDGYAYLGPVGQITRDERAEIVTGANVSAELSEPLGGAFFNALAFYGGRLGRGLPYRPALIISVDSPGPALFRGDVTDTGVISVRFHGDAWRNNPDQVATFVWHEAFHLWNSHSVVALDGESAPWLHEGGADYAALVGAVSTGAIDEDGGRARLAQRLNGCRRVLGVRPFDPARLQSGNGPYDCGVVIQWLADLELRRAGKGDVFTLWAGMLDSPSGYGVGTFRARLVPDSAVGVVLDGDGPGRWSNVEQRLATLGVTLENRPGDTDLMAAALFHVAGRNCKGSYGFFNDPGALKLDGDDCGALSGQPLIATVESFDPQAESRAMFAAVQARCAVGQPVRYLTRDDRTLEATCDAPLVDPKVWAIASSPPLAVGGT